MAALLLAFVLVGCNGGGGSDDEETVPPPATVTVSGTIRNGAGPLEGVALKSWLVTTPATDSEQSNTVSDAAGNFTINVLPDTDTYFDLTMEGYATLNSQFSAFTQNVVGIDFPMIALSDAEQIIDTAFDGLMLELADKAWLAIYVIDAAGAEVDGVEIDTTPTADGGGALKCDGTLTGGSYTAAEPPCDPSRSGPMYLAYFDNDVELTISAGDGEAGAAAPVRLGEMTYVYLPWNAEDVATAQLEVSVEEGGIVKTEPSFFQCVGPANCAAQIPVGTHVRMIAIAGAGYKFDDWDGCDFEASEAVGEVCVRAISDTEDNSTSVQFDRSDVAAPKVTLTVQTGEGGRVTTSPDVMECFGADTCQAEVPVGSIVTLTATPNDGYRFDDWEGCDQETKDPAQGTCSRIISAVNANNIQADFELN